MYRSDKEIEDGYLDWAGDEVDDGLDMDAVRSVADDFCIPERAVIKALSRLGYTTE